MKTLNFKDKARILNNELNAYGTQLKHGQALNLLAKIEGYKTYADYKKESEQKTTQTIEIDKELWSSFISKREDIGVPVETQLEALIEQELYQTEDKLKMYRYDDANFDTYFVIGKNKQDALLRIDSSYMPPNFYDISRVKEINLETLYGMIIFNKWKGIDNSMYHMYDSEIDWVDGSGIERYPETLIAYYNCLESMGFEYGLVPDYTDEQIIKQIKEARENDPEKYTKYMELDQLVLETDKKVKEDR